MKLLVVEDNGHHICSAEKFFAEKAGVEVHFVGTLASFDEAVYKHRFDGVLTDIFFPCGKTRFPAVFLPQDIVGKSENPRFSGILVS